ncbi:interferon lambda receptor 1 [Anguilla rostrata]|uniref:interferon lambda receptor 1 n=1 Tax=Anguilla rostrata TaxID=7938 RepID=UPI0030D2A219
MWRWTVVALALSRVVGVLSVNNTVYLESRDFRHRLRWPGEQDPTVRYSVQYKIYGEEWKDKKECQNITSLSCDLTNELCDIRNYYYGKVTANGVKLGQSARFHPLRSTVLSPPVVTITPSVRSLSLSVTVPSGPDPSQSMVDFILPDPISYKANLTYHNKTHKIVIIEMTTNSSEIQFNRLQNNTEYHVSVRYVLPVNKQSEAFQRTVKTLAIPDRTELLAIPALLAVCVLLTSSLAFCQMFVRRKSLMPDVLKNLASSGSLPVIRFPAERITTPEVYARVTDVCVDKKPPSAPPRPGGDSYTPQVCDPDEQPWHCKSYSSQQREPDVQSNSRGSSTNYSLVFVQRQDGGGTSPKSNGPTPSGAGPCLGQVSAGASELAAPNGLVPVDQEEEESGTLVLPTFRRSDGRLEVSSLFTFLQVEEEKEEEEATAPEVGALGEESSGAGVGGTSYLPNQTVPTVPYASQQNWTPKHIPDWNVPSVGHAPSGYRGNGQEAVALLPQPPQEMDPGAGGGVGEGGAAGRVQGYFSQMFSDAWGLSVQE